MLNFKSNSLDIAVKLLGLSDIIILGIYTHLSAHKIIISVKSTYECVSYGIYRQLPKKLDVGDELQLRYLSILGQETFSEITQRQGYGLSNITELFH